MADVSASLRGMRRLSCIRSDLAASVAAAQAASALASCAIDARGTPVPSCRCSNSVTAGATKRLPPTGTGQLAFLEARHRAHARVEDRIRHAKDAGLGRFPSREFAINQAWLAATTLAADLVAWLRLLALTGQLATAEPKALRYRLLDVPARLTRSGRRRHLRIPATWPWIHDIVAVFARIAAIPLPA